MKTQKQVEALINKRNLEFKGKTKAQKRVLIAKDVIAQINAKKIRPKSGFFVGISKKAIAKGGDLRENLLSDKIPSCQCCALGSLFCSAVLYNNSVDLSDMVDTNFQNNRPAGKYGNTGIGDAIDDGNEMKNGLNEIFDREQLILIERAFEEGRGYFGIGYYEERSDRAIEFGQKYRNANKRLISIMQNIVDHKGIFKP